MDTPEFKVGELYPTYKEVDYSHFDAWTLHKAALQRQLDDRKHQRKGTSKTLFQKKMKSTMKWHPAGKARRAQKQLRDTLKGANIDPGHGYKIDVVRDLSVMPPPMPPTPPPQTPPLAPLKSVNSVLMKGAEDRAQKKKTKAATKEEQKDPNEKENKVDKPPLTIEMSVCFPFAAQKKPPRKVVSCLGCRLATCLHKKSMEMAVATYSSVKDTEKLMYMNRTERVEWFLQLYGQFDGSKSGLVCADKYARRELVYLTAAYLLREDDKVREQLGFQSDEDSKEEGVGTSLLEGSLGNDTLSTAGKRELAYQEEGLVDVSDDESKELFVDIAEGVLNQLQESGDQKKEDKIKK